MPLPILDVPTYPFVPLVPGVPSLIRAPVDGNAPALLAQAAATGSPSPLLLSMLQPAGSPGSTPSFLNGVNLPISQLSTELDPSAVTSDDVSQNGAASQAQWGLFDSNGGQVLQPDSIVSFDWSGSYRVIDYPIEEGNFETYNKVQQPFEVHLVMRKGGTVSDRQNFIDALNNIRGDLNLYTATTPEISYPNVNITDVSYGRRADAGATVIEATVICRQINVSASTTFTNTQSPTSQDTFNGGTVDATAPTSTQAASVPSGGPS